MLVSVIIDFATLRTVATFSSYFDLGEVDRIKNFAQLGGVGGRRYSCRQKFVYKALISRICWNVILNSLDLLDSLDSFILVPGIAICLKRKIKSLIGSLIRNQ